MPPVECKMLFYILFHKYEQICIFISSKLLEVAWVGNYTKFKMFSTLTTNQRHYFAFIDFYFVVNFSDVVNYTIFEEFRNFVHSVGERREMTTRQDFSLNIFTLAVFLVLYSFHTWKNDVESSNRSISNSNQSAPQIEIRIEYAMICETKLVFIRINTNVGRTTSTNWSI